MAYACSSFVAFNCFSQDLFDTPSGQIAPRPGTPAKVASPLRPKTARHQVALELLQTERNYVEILSTILKVCPA